MRECVCALFIFTIEQKKYCANYQLCVCRTSPFFFFQISDFLLFPPPHNHQSIFPLLPPALAPLHLPLPPLATGHLRDGTSRRMHPTTLAGITVTPRFSSIKRGVQKAPVVREPSGHAIWTPEQNSFTH